MVGGSYLDLSVQATLLVIELLVVVGIHPEVVESELLLDALLELQTLLEGQAVGLGNDRDNVDNIRKLLQHDDVNGLERVTRRLDEEEAAVDASILDISLTLGRKLLSEIGGVLVLDVFDNGVPAAVVVNEIAVSGSVNNVEPQTNTVLLNDVRDRVNLGGGANALIGLHATLGVDKVRGEHGVDKSRLSETGLT